MRIIAKTRRSAELNDLKPLPLRLKLLGFGEQEMVPVDRIIAALDRLPGHHLSDVKAIIYAPSWTPSADCPIRPAYLQHFPKAEFIQRQREIVFYELGNLELFHHVLYHEIGHVVFYLALNSRVKKQWVTQIHPHSTCVTAYGSTNASEDFAETYAYYLVNPQALQQLPAKYAFMHDWVFSGRRESLKEKNVMEQK